MKIGDLLSRRRRKINKSKEEKTKLGKKSKRKGKKFESDFSKELSLWLTEGQDQNVFVWTHGSGSRGKINEEEAGDIMAIKPEGDSINKNFRFELKSYKNIDLFKLIRPNTKGDIESWWEQYSKEIIENRENRCLILVIKMNYKGIYLIIDKSLFNLLIDLCGTVFKEKYLSWNNLIIMHWEAWKESFGGPTISNYFKKK